MSFCFLVKIIIMTLVKLFALGDLAMGNSGVFGGFAMIGDLATAESFVVIMGLFNSGRSLSD